MYMNLQNVPLLLHSFQISLVNDQLRDIVEEKIIHLILQKWTQV